MALFGLGTRLHVIVGSESNTKPREFWFDLMETPADRQPDELFLSGGREGNLAEHRFTMT